MSEEDELLRELAGWWERVDPAPPDLTERMIAAVAVVDLDREFEELLRVEESTQAVRGVADPVSLQFTDGQTNVLIRVTREKSSTRLDGWVDATIVATAVIVGGTAQGAGELTGPGRFVFEGVPSGLTQVRLVVLRDDAPREFVTPAFEI